MLKLNRWLAAAMVAATAALIFNGPSGPSPASSAECTNQGELNDMNNRLEDLQADYLKTKAAHDAALILARKHQNMTKKIITESPQDLEWARSEIYRETLAAEDAERGILEDCDDR